VYLDNPASHMDDSVRRSEFIFRLFLLRASQDTHHTLKTLALLSQYDKDPTWVFPIGKSFYDDPIGLVSDNTDHPIVLWW
jgi:hypothetical protein